MTEEDCERPAKRYIRYLGVEQKSEGSGKPFNFSVGGFMFTSYTAFLFGGEKTIPLFEKAGKTPYTDAFMDEKRYNDLVAEWDLAAMPKNVLEYSSAEELDFMLSAMGF